MISAQPQAKVDNMAAKTRKRIGLIITNCQNMCVCVCRFTVFTVFNTLWTHMLISSSILTVAEGGSNDIYDVVSSKRGVEHLSIYVKYLPLY